MSKISIFITVICLVLVGLVVWFFAANGGAMWVMISQDQPKLIKTLNTALQRSNDAKFWDVTVRSSEKTEAGEKWVEANFKIVKSDNATLSYQVKKTSNQFEGVKKYWFTKGDDALGLGTLYYEYADTKEYCTIAFQASVISVMGGMSTTVGEGISIHNLDKIVLFEDGQAEMLKIHASMSGGFSPFYIGEAFTYTTETSSGEAVTQTQNRYSVSAALNLKKISRHTVAPEVTEDVEYKFFKISDSGSVDLPANLDEFKKVLVIN